MPRAASRAHAGAWLTRLVHRADSASPQPLQGRAASCKSANSRSLSRQHIGHARLKSHIRQAAFRGPQHRPRSKTHGRKKRKIHKAATPPMELALSKNASVFAVVASLQWWPLCMGATRQGKPRWSPEVREECHRPTRHAPKNPSARYRVHAISAGEHRPA